MQLRGTEVTTPSIDPPNIYTSELHHLVPPIPAEFDTPATFNAERYLLGSSLEITPRANRHLLDAPPEVTMTSLSTTTYFPTDDAFDLTLPTTTDQYDDVLKFVFVQESDKILGLGRLRNAQVHRTMMTSSFKLPNYSPHFEASR